MKLLKVRGKHVSRIQGEEIVPEIRISGKWLLELGIKPGSTIQIHIECNEIIIKAINNPPNQKQIANHNI
jgi:hypothetical protein